MKTSNSSEKKVELLASHYQSTFELTHQMWQLRNRKFIILLITMGFATLLTFATPETNSLLVDIIAKVLNVSDPARVAELRGSFPFGLIQSILLVAILYLMVNLHHHSLTVSRNYRYLGELEKEIREILEIGKGKVSFTREGSFYWENRGEILGFVKWIYIVLLGVLLVLFLAGKLTDDFQQGSILFSIVDSAIGLIIIVFYFYYSRSAVRLDRPSESVRSAKK